MSDFISTNRVWAIVLVAAIFVAAVSGIIGYNLGLSHTLNLKLTNTINSFNNANGNKTSNELINNINSNEQSINNNLNNINNELPATNESTELEGIIGKITTDSFTLTTLREYPQATKPTDYLIAINQQTKITETVAQITIPAGDGLPQTNITTRALKATDLKAGQKAEVVTVSQLTDPILIAATINIKTMIKK